MTRRDEVIRMAREAGFPCIGNEPIIACGRDELEQFAALVADAERERCAKFCDMVAMLDNDNALAGCCAEVIRALKDEASE